MLKLIDNLRQGHLARWTKAVRQLTPPDVASVSILPNAEYYSVALHAAITAGWFGEGVEATAVDGLNPKRAKQLAEQIWEIYDNAYKPDPN